MNKRKYVVKRAVRRKNWWSTGLVFLVSNRDRRGDGIRIPLRFAIIPVQFITKRITPISLSRWLGSPPSLLDIYRVLPLILFLTKLLRQSEHLRKGQKDWYHTLSIQRKKEGHSQAHLLSSHSQGDRLTSLINKRVTYLWGFYSDGSCAMDKYKTVRVNQLVLTWLVLFLLRRLPSINE